MVTLDIRCPNCGRTDPVEKVGLGEYRCRECETRFDREDIEVPG
jgi:DNA-directed RNA polymerase subunit RPC12/RpoP